LETLRGLSEIFMNIAVGAASIAAVLGARSEWKKYNKKRQNELIVEVLESFYRVRDAFKRIRSPFGFSGEGATRLKQESETLEEKELFDRAYVPIERYKKEEEVFRNLDGLKYKFIANFGKEKAKLFEDLIWVLNQIIFTSNMLRTSWIQQGRPFRDDQSFQGHLERMHKFEGIIWEGAHEPDEIKQKIDSAINEMESICEKLLKEM